MNGVSPVEEPPGALVSPRVAYRSEHTREMDGSVRGSHDLDLSPPRIWQDELGSFGCRGEAINGHRQGYVSQTCRVDC